MISLCCSWFGYSLAAAHRREENTLRQLISALEYMQCELQFHLTSLPELCIQVGKYCKKGCVSSYFYELAKELNAQILPEPQSCCQAALEKTKGIPQASYDCLETLGKGLGKFDLDGEVLGLESVRIKCREKLEGLCARKDEQRRSYQTLGICAGAALVILLI